MFKTYRKLGMMFKILLELVYNIFKNCKVSKVYTKLLINYDKMTKVLQKLGFRLEHIKKDVNMKYNDEYTYSVIKSRFN